MSHYVSNPIAGQFKYLATIERQPWSIWSQMIRPQFYQVIIVSDREVSEFGVVGPRWELGSGEPEPPLKNYLHLPVGRGPTDANRIYGFYAFFVERFEVSLLLENASVVVSEPVRHNFDERPLP